MSVDSASPIELYMYAWALTPYPPEETEAWAASFDGGAQDCVEGDGGQLNGMWRLLTGKASNTGPRVDYSRDAFQFGRPLVLEEAPASMVVHLTEWAIGTGAPDAPVPEVVVEALLASSPMPEGRSWDAPPVESRLLAGSSDPATLHPLLLGEHPHVSHMTVKGRSVYKVEIPLDSEVTRAAEGETLTMHVRVFVQNPVCGDSMDDPTAMAPWIMWYASAEHPSYVQFHAADPVALESAEARVNGEDLEVDLIVSSLFRYVDLQVTATSPDGELTERIRTTWLPPSEQQPQNDHFQVIIQNWASIANEQPIHIEITDNHTKSTLALDLPIDPEATLHYQDGEFVSASVQEAESPAIGLAVLLLAMGVSMVFLRRTRRD